MHCQHSTSAALVQYNNTNTTRVQPMHVNARILAPADRAGPANASGAAPPRPHRCRVGGKGDPRECGSRATQQGLEHMGFPGVSHEGLPRPHGGIARSVVGGRLPRPQPRHGEALLHHSDGIKTAEAGSKFISVGDLKEGFNQAGIGPETAAKMAVLTASGCCLPHGITFGSTNGPEEFQKRRFREIQMPRRVQTRALDGASGEKLRTTTTPDFAPTPSDAQDRPLTEAHGADPPVLPNTVPERSCCERGALRKRPRYWTQRPLAKSSRHKGQERAVCNLTECAVAARRWAPGECRGRNPLSTQTSINIPRRPPSMLWQWPTPLHEHFAPGPELLDGCSMCTTIMKQVHSGAQTTAIDQKGPNLGSQSTHHSFLSFDICSRVNGFTKLAPTIGQRRVNKHCCAPSVGTCSVAK